MGRTFVESTIKTKHFNEDIAKLKKQAAYMHGHSYSGQINMLDENKEFTEYHFFQLLQKQNHIVDKEELQIYNKYEKEGILKINKILAKKNILKEITFMDFIKYMLHKKIPTWKKLILNGLKYESDILWYIEYKKYNYVYWGYCRC